MSAMIETEIGMLPSDWQVSRIGDEFELQQGKSLSAASRNGASPRPFLRTSNVFWGRIDAKTVDRMSFSDEEAQRLALRAGDLLVCEGGDIGRTAIWKDEIPGSLYQNHLHRLRASNSEIDPAFVMYWLQAAFTQMDIFAHVGNRTTIPNLSGNRLKQIPIPKPPLAEQKAISGHLNALQSAISVQDRIIAKLKELKAATMAKLFREGLRGEPLKQTEIGEMPESWNVVPLGDLLSTAQYGLSVRGEKAGATPILRMNCQLDGRVVMRDLQFVSLSDEHLRSHILQDGDILFNRTNSFELVGRTAIFRGNEKATFASYLIRLKTNRGATPSFINHFLNWSPTQRALKGLATRGVSQSNISASKLRTLLVPKPSTEEQAAIAAVLDQLDKRIREAATVKERLSDLFSVTLNELMTGKRRIGRLNTVPPEEA